MVLVQSPKHRVDQRQRVEAQKRSEVAQAKRDFNDNDKSFMGNKAQGIFNAYIRKRDDQEPCISCGGTGDVLWCAGHFRTRGAAGHLRFNEDNCHKQCNRHCNMMLSGNIENYRPRLIEKIGLERVEALENNNEIKRWTIDDYREIIEIYSEKLRDYRPVLE